MAGADDIWGQKEQPKAPTAAETLRPWGLGNTTGQVADKDGVADYQRPGSGVLVNTADKADSDPLAWLKSKWQQEQRQSGQYQQSGTDAFVNTAAKADSDPLAWLKKKWQQEQHQYQPGNTSLTGDDNDESPWPTFEQMQQKFFGSGVNKEDDMSTENNDDESYLQKILNQLILGNATDDVTALGTAAQVVLGLLEWDLPADARDLSYDITHWQTTPEHIGQTALDAIGFIPIIGDIKYADEIDTLAKNADKAADVAKAGENAAEGAEDIKVGSFDDLSDTAKSTFESYEKNGWKGTFNGQTPGTNAGRVWENKLGDLPIADSYGKKITYREFDVNNRIYGASRDSERFLVSSDGSIYYTSDHYDSFIKIQ